MSKPDTERGIRRKYDVKRADGSSEPGGKHAECSYFVLDLEHDPFAIPALKAYAKACRETHPELAANIDSIVGYKPPRCNCREAGCPHSLLQALAPSGPSEFAAALMGANADEAP
jgi:hypothetical protein